MNWYTAPESGPELDRLLNAWPGVPVEQLELLDMILDTAREQVLAYAPSIRPVVQEDGYLTGDPTPARYALAQLRQAQSIWDAGTVSSSGDIGDGGYTFTPRPMDKTIKQIIRPADGKPHAL